MGSVAAQVASWQRRARNRPGPLGPVSAGSGDSPAGTVQVELLVDGSWQDITSYVMARDGSGKIAITRGQPNEGGHTDPSRCTLHLNNRDRRWSPRNPAGPLYGKIGRNVQLRVSTPSGNDRVVRFLGEVTAWPHNSDSTGTDVWVEMDAAGVLQRLGQGNSPIGSAMRVALASGTPTNTVVAYWPCEDAAGAAVLGSAVSGVPALAISGTAVLATSSDFVCSGPLPTMGTASFSARIPVYTPPGGLNGLNPFNTLLRFLLEIPVAGATDGQVVAAFTWTGGIPRWEVYYAAAGGGQLGLRGRDNTGTVVQDTGVGGPALNGVKVHVTASFDEAGGISLEFGLSILPVGGSTPSGPSGFVLGPATGIVQSVTVAPGRGLPGTVVGHVSVQLTPSYPTDGADLALALMAYAGETAADRIRRLCGLAGLTFGLVGNASDTAAMGTQLSATVLALIDDAVAADGGLLYERTSALGLGYRTRVSLENQTPALALSYSASQLSTVPVPLDDDQYTRNDITVSRVGGSSARATLREGHLSVLAPPLGVGQYDQSTTINIQADAGLPDQAGWRLHLGTVDEVRYPQLSINLARTPITGAIRSSALGLRPGDRVTVSGAPDSPDGISQILLGTSETIDAFQHEITFNCAPESPYRVAVTDDAVFGRADTDGSQLTVDAQPTDTTLLVATTTPGSPRWTTDPAEVPFDIRIAGEQITATGITSVIADSFARTVANGWGSADTGQTWTATGGSAGDYAVASGAGQHVANSVNVFRVTAVPQPVADFDLRVNFSTSAFPAGDSEYVFLIARYTDGNNMLFARVQLAPTTGAMTLSIRKRTSAGGEVQLSSYSSSLTVAAGTVYWLRFSGAGSSFEAKLWPSGSPEPGWQTSASDSDVSVAGAAGLRTLLGPSSSNTLPVTFSFDAFEMLNWQAFTVVRSVNGVVKNQVAGADVRLNQAAITGL